MGQGFPFGLSSEGSRCGLHVLYITDICHAGVSNSNPCETFLPSDLARQRQGVQEEGQCCSHTGLLSVSVLKRSAEVGKQHGGVFSSLIRTQV